MDAPMVSNSRLEGSIEATSSFSFDGDNSQEISIYAFDCPDVPELQIDWDMPVHAFSGNVTASSLPDPRSVSEPRLPYSGFLICLPINNPVAQQNATYILQMIRPYPSMMTRKDTLPPFIHPCLGADDLGMVFPEPLANCLSIARMFVWRTPETRDFLWKTVWAEQQRLADKAENLEAEDLLASLQALTIYVIMRVVDYSSGEADRDMQTLLYCERVSLCLLEVVNGDFGISEQERPNRTWKDWVFAESSRRYLCIWFLLNRMISMRMGKPCRTDAYLLLPLPAPRSLWEAASAEAWKAEYECTYPRPELPRLQYFGDLVDAQNRTDNAQVMQKLDLWNAEADQLGMMLTLATALV